MIMTSIANRPFHKYLMVVFSGRMRLSRLYLLAVLLAFVMLMLWGMPQQAEGRPEIGSAAGNLPSRAVLGSSEPLSFTVSFTTYLPVVFKPVPKLKDLVTKITLTLPQPLAAPGGNWCTWGYCSLSPRLYHEPLGDGRALVGWTDSSGNGHVNLISTSGMLDQTYDFPDRSVRGMVAHDDGKWAILLWDSNSKIMWLSKRNLNGSEIWATNIDGSLTSFNPEIGDSRLAYGNNLYAAYFAVHGDT